MTHEEEVKGLAAAIRNHAHNWMGSATFGMDEADYIAERLLADYIPHSAILPEGMTKVELRDAVLITKLESFQWNLDTREDMAVAIVNRAVGHLLALLAPETPEDTGGGERSNP